MTTATKRMNIVERKGVFTLTLWPGGQFEKKVGSFEGIEKIWERLYEQGFRAKVLPKPNELAKALLDDGIYQSKYIAIELSFVRLTKKTE